MAGGYTQIPYAAGWIANSPSQGDHTAPILAFNDPGDGTSGISWNAANSRYEDKGNDTGAWWDGVGTTGWITLNFGSQKTFSKLHYWGYDTPGWTNIGAKNVDLQISSDGNTWTTVKSATWNQAPGTAGYAGSDQLLDAPVTTQYFRLNITSNWGGAGYIAMDEIWFYQAQVGAPGGQLPNSTAVSIANLGTLDLNGNPQTIASLTGVAGSAVTLGAGTLTLGDTSSTAFLGVISGAGSL
ncbi:MAG: discoidin domain-containing protein, partial [Thermoguttaceae bacterium]